MNKELVGLRAAAEIAGVSEVSILKWCRRLGIGQLRDGRWYIDRRKLYEVINARKVLRLREPV